MRTRRSQRSPSQLLTDEAQTDDDAPEEVPHTIAKGHTKRRRDEEREAGMAVKSAKKARRIGRATAAAQHQQAAADSEETLEHAADAHAAATGSPGPGPDADVQQLSTPGAGLAGVPSPSSPAQAVAAAGRHDAAGAHPGGDELDGDDADRLPDSVVQELLRRQRMAAADTAAVGAGPITAEREPRLLGQKAARAPLTQRSVGPVTVKVLDKHQTLPRSEQAAVFMKQHLIGSAPRSIAMLQPVAREAAANRIAQLKPSGQGAKLSKKQPRTKPGWR